jgi:hypothetical protein
MRELQSISHKLLVTICYRHRRPDRQGSPRHRTSICVPAKGELCATAVTVAEIRYGLERLPDGRRKDNLLAAATEVFTPFSDFIQPFDAGAAIWYATIVPPAPASRTAPGRLPLARQRGGNRQARR